MVINFVKRWEKDKEWKNSMMGEDICYRVMWRNKYGWKCKNCVFIVFIVLFF